MRDLLWRVVRKCDDDDIFFMAGAIAFNVVIALFPLLVLAIGIAGYVLAGYTDPAQQVLQAVTEALPRMADTDLAELVRAVIRRLLLDRADFTLAGSIFFLWVGTRLAGCLRVALRTIFSIEAKRNPVTGKLFDIVVVVVGVLLLTLNMGVTLAASVALDFGFSFLGLGGETVGWAERIAAIAIAFGSIWILVFLAYRFIPAEPIPVRTAIIAASITAVGHETLKFGFSWYATQVANWGSTLGTLATAAVFFFWIYYESLVFILGGEVAHVYTMRRNAEDLAAPLESGT